MSFSLLFVTQSLAYLFLSIELFQLSIFVVYTAGYLLIYFVDLITRESIDPIKFTIITALVIISLFFSFSPNSFTISFYPNGELGVFVGEGYFSIFYYGTSLLIGAFYLQNSLNVHINTPKKLKKYSILYLLSSILFGIPAIIFSILKLTRVIPALHLISLAFGACLLFLAFKLYPKLAYILPFHVRKLIVIETKRGIPVFYHDWEKLGDILDHALFTAMFRAVSSFIEVKMGKGSIREIKVEKSILIIEKEPVYPIIYVLESNKFSTTLRNGLHCFAARFVKQYSEFFSNPSNVNSFKPAIELINQCFSFIPDYD